MTSATSQASAFTHTRIGERAHLRAIAREHHERKDRERQLQGSGSTWLRISSGPRAALPVQRDDDDGRDDGDAAG